MGISNLHTADALMCLRVPFGFASCIRHHACNDAVGWLLKKHVTESQINWLVLVPKMNK